MRDWERQLLRQKKHEAMLLRLDKAPLVKMVLLLEEELRRAKVYSFNPFEHIVGIRSVARFVGYYDQSGIYRKLKDGKSILDRLLDAGVCGYKYTGYRLRKSLYLIPHLYAIWLREKHKIENKERRLSNAGRKRRTNHSKNRGTMVGGGQGNGQNNE